MLIQMDFISYFIFLFFIFLFLDLKKEVTDPAKGYLKNDSIIVEIEVQAEAPHGVL